MKKLIINWRDLRGKYHECSRSVDASEAADLEANPRAVGEHAPFEFMKALIEEDIERKSVHVFLG